MYMLLPLWRPLNCSGLLPVTLLAACLTALSIVRRGLLHNIGALTVAFVHFWVLVVSCVWIWVVPSSWDVIFIAYHIIRMISYFLAGNECLINYAEKRFIDKDYVLGSEPSDEPYINGLPRFLQILDGICLTLLVPYMIYVTFATYRTTPETLPVRVVVALIVALYSMYDFAKFSLPKFQTLQ